MNEFYSITEEGAEPISEFQLRNLGEKTVSMIIGGVRPSEYWGTRGTDRSVVYRKVTSDDYDKQFASVLTNTKPIYRCVELIEHHASFYVNERKGEREKFIQQMKYMVLPILEKKKGKEAFATLLKDWLDENDKSKSGKGTSYNLNFGDVNAPSQFQVGSPGGSQQQTVKYKNENVLELFRLLKSDLNKLESDIREDFELEINNAVRQLDKGKDISSRLLTIGGLIKDVGIGTLTNLIASPVFEVMKPYLGLP